MNDNASSAMHAAMAALSAGRQDDAERVYQRLLAARPNSKETQLLGGIVAARTGRRSDAISRFKTALRLDPNLNPAHAWLAILILEEGRAQEALPHALAAHASRPDDIPTLRNLAICLFALEQAADAAAVLERGIELRPGDTALLLLLAGAYEALGRDAHAAAFLERAAQQTADLDTLLRLGNALVKAGRSADAVAAYSRALAAEPGSVPAHLGICRAYTDLLRHEEAYGHLERAAAIAPDDPAVPLRRAHLLQMRGRFSDAEAEFDRALELEPGLGVAYHNWVAAKRITEADAALVERIRAAIVMPGLSPSNEANLHFALGKALDDLGECGKAMEEYNAANRIEFEGRVRNHALDKSGFASLVDARIRIFGRSFFSPARAASETNAPIFIVGMPRSGTTLIEQILSCHPDVAAAGELSFWAHSEGRLVDFSQGSVDRPGLFEAAHQYLDLTDTFADGKPRVTDKNPANCLCLGLIHTAFPNARIVRARRDAADTALSIYTTPWANPPDFASDKENIAAFFEQYLRLMKHWRETLPDDRYRELCYEDLVADPEPVLRGLLEFCGLEWNEACLHPEDNPRTVRTPSFWQVRQPLYRSSVHRWERFRDFLGPFERLIGLD